MHYILSKLWQNWHEINNVHDRIIWIWISIGNQHQLSSESILFQWLYLFVMFWRPYVMINCIIIKSEVTSYFNDNISEYTSSWYFPLLFDNISFNPLFLLIELSSPSKSPPPRPPPSNILEFLGYRGLEQLHLIRIIPRNNPRRVFELRRYVCPLDKPMQRMLGPREFQPFPTEEYIVLSTSGGKVFAILEYGVIFSVIYNFKKCRLKINMRNEQISPLTTEEISDIPVGTRRSFSKNFKAIHVTDINQNLPHN